MPEGSEKQAPETPVTKEYTIVERRKVIHQDVFEDAIDNRTKRETERVEVVKTHGGEEPSSHGTSRALVVALVLVGIVAIFAVLAAGYAVTGMRYMQTQYQPQDEQQVVDDKRQDRLPLQEEQVPPQQQVQEEPQQIAPPQRPRSVGVDLNTAPRPVVGFRQWSHDAPSGYHWERGEPGDQGCRQMPNGVLRCPNKLVRD